MLLKILSVPLRAWLHNSDKCQAPFPALSGLSAFLQSRHFFLCFSCKLIVSSKEIAYYQSKNNVTRMISSFPFAKYFPFYFFYGFIISMFQGGKKEYPHSPRRNDCDFLISLNYTKQGENVHQQKSFFLQGMLEMLCAKSSIWEKNKCITGRALLQWLCSYGEHHSSSCKTRVQ